MLPINCNGRILTGYFQFFLTQPSYIKMLISSGMAVFFYLVIKKQQQQERIFNRTIIPAWYLPLKIDQLCLGQAREASQRRCCLKVADKEDGNTLQ